MEGKKKGIKCKRNEWYAKGRNCKYGENCRYEHNKLCRWVERLKKCKRDKCRFSHDETVMCKWDKESGCTRGETCKFIHQEKERKERQESENKASKPTLQKRERESNKEEEQQTTMEMEERIVERLTKIMKMEMWNIRNEGEQQNFWNIQDQNYYPPYQRK